MRRLIVALLCSVPLAAWAQAQEPAKPAAPAPAAKEAAPAPAPAMAEPAKAEPKEEGSYEVVDVKLGTGVKDREPEGVAESFPASVGKVYCWTKIAGPEGGEITHAWYKGDEKMGEVKLAVKFKSMRTWSAKTIPADGTGSWRVDVLGPDGAVLKSVPFKVE